MTVLGEAIRRFVRCIGRPTAQPRVDQSVHIDIHRGPEARDVEIERRLSAVERSNREVRMTLLETQARPRDVRRQRD